MSIILKQSIAGCIAMSIAGTILLGASSAIAQTALAGGWKLVNMTVANSPMPMLPVGDTALVAEFADGRISGSGGCNRFMGDYETQRGKLSIGTLASTFKACEEPIMSQELKYLTALQGAQRYEVDSGQLTIFYENEQGAGVLRFVSQNSEPVEPVRALW